MKRLAGMVMLLAAGSALANGNTNASSMAAPAMDAQVAFWTVGYTGADLASTQAPCAAPEVPEVSQRNLEIRSVGRAINQWERCHAGYMQQLTATPAHARIPAEVLAAMSAQEREQALRHLEGVQARMVEEARTNASAAMARHDAWLLRTVAYVSRENASIAASKLPVLRNQLSARYESRSEREERREALRRKGY